MLPNWTCAPQVRDLPRDLKIEMTCACCPARRVTSAGAMMEARLGAQFLDLIEGQARCEACGGAMRFDYAGKPEPKVAEVVAVPRSVLPERFLRAPVRVRRRSVAAPAGLFQLNLPQLSLPMPLPAAPVRRALPRMAGR